MNSIATREFRYSPNLFYVLLALALVADLCSIIYLVILSIVNWVELSDLLFFSFIVLLQVIVFPLILVSFVSVDEDGVRLRKLFRETFTKWADIESKETKLGLWIIQPKRHLFNRRLYIFKFLVGYKDLADLFRAHLGDRPVSRS